MASDNKSATFLLHASEPGAFDSQVAFGLLRLTSATARELLRLMDLADDLDHQLRSFDEIVLFDESVAFYAGSEDFGQYREVVDEAAEAAGGALYTGEGVVHLPVEVPLDSVGFGVSLDVRRVHVEAQSVYWSALFSDNMRVQTSLLSKKVLEEFVRGE